MSKLEFHCTVPEMSLDSQVPVMGNTSEDTQKKFKTYFYFLY
jgi:hypothetical protein